MKPNAIPPQTPPVIEACPWCAGDLVVADEVAACDGCGLDIPLIVESRLAVAA